MALLALGYRQWCWARLLVVWFLGVEGEIVDGFPARPTTADSMFQPVRSVKPPSGRFPPGVPTGVPG